MIKKLVEKCLDFFLRYKSFQDYINSRFDLNEFINIDGNYYALNHSILSVGDVKNCYKFDNIKSTDVILDIGANIGGFAIPASRSARRVYAVEPLYGVQLQNNIHKNNIDNIFLFNYGLGKGKIKLRYNEKKNVVKCLSLSEIINLCGGHIDFLKLDCEGGEWSIEPNELKGIRRIEAEVHNFDGKHDFNDFLKILSIARFEYEYEIQSLICMIVHASQQPTVDSIIRATQDLTEPT